LYALNMHEDVTVSVPTVAAEKPQVLVHEEPSQMPILKVVAVGVPQTATVVEDARVPALVIPAAVHPAPVMVSEAVPATKVSGAPTVRVPTAAVRTPVAVLIAVTATGAAWVVTWKLPAAGLIA